MPANSCASSSSTSSGSFTRTNRISPGPMTSARSSSPGRRPAASTASLGKFAWSLRERRVYPLLRILAGVATRKAYATSSATAADRSGLKKRRGAVRDSVVGMTTEGVKTILYPVRDLAKAKTLFSTLLGQQPAHDAPYYVGYEVDGQQIGLVPNGHDNGMTGPLPYVHVSDIEARLQALVDAGAEPVEAIKDVGGGR